MSCSSSCYELQLDDLAHLRIPLEEIKSATDNFSFANNLWRNGSIENYKGQLSGSGQRVDIVARWFRDQSEGRRKKMFWREVSTLSRLEHQNIVSMVGFCEEDGHNIIIYNHESTHGDLLSHLRDSTLTWMRRLEICVGVARALSYIYYDEGRDFSVIHRDINSDKILLDGRWEPKLSGFELSITQAAIERNLPCQVPDDDIWFKAVYMDPTCIETGNVSHKSDMFSLGVLLLQLLGFKNSTIPGVNRNRLAKSLYREGRLYDLVHPGLQKQIGQQSFKIFSKIVYDCLNDQPSERPSIDQILIPLEKALESQRIYDENRLISDDYSRLEDTAFKSYKRQLAHLQIPFEEIVSATDNFSDANFIGNNGFGNEYKGQLLLSGHMIRIVARRLDKTYGHGDREFWTEVSMLSKLEHRNLVSIVGFCDENGEKVIINKHDSAHGLLYKHIRDPNLTWMRRLEICVGVARGLSYIYYVEGRDFSVIHRDIKSGKILLDEKWEAKLSGFEFSITQQAGRRSRLCLYPPRGTWGYVDPTYVESGSVTHKSDVYSFGILLFEVLCGKYVRMVHEEDHNTLFVVSSARSHYERGRLEDMIDPRLWKQMDSKSFKSFSETAYYCVKEQRPQRPNIDQVLIKLEEALRYQREHDDKPAASSTVNGTTTRSFKEKDLKHLEIPLADIKMATKDFHNDYLIGSGSFGDVYKAELDHFDSETLLQSDEKSIGELPKKRSIVAIKHIKITEDEVGAKGFLAEIEMLSNCKHPNIVSLLGFCEEGRDMILVYEHASRGSLNDYLGRAAKFTNLSWVRRLKIGIDIARGLNYLHTKIEDDRRIIHRDIKSDNILLSENWEAKIADFGLSKFRQENQQLNNTIYTYTIAGTELYLDPEYLTTGKLKNESDIYSLGVVLLEILSGRFANDTIYTNENSNGIAHVARRRFNDKTIWELVDPRLMEETQKSIFFLTRGPDENSLKAFAEIAYRCIAESQTERPRAEEVIKKLEEALLFQENVKDPLEISLVDIQLATQNFSNSHLIDRSRFGKVYKGEVAHATNGRNGTIAAKRLDLDNRDQHEFLMELQVLLEYKHENLIGLIGYCNEKDEKIIVYEYASRGSLDKHLRNKELTWRKRLEICIDIATALDFLHGGSLTQDVVIHRDIKSFNVVLTHDWKAKITNFDLSLIRPITKDIDIVIDNDIVSTYGYADPLYVQSGIFTKKYDIYSLGVVLFEILCGRFAYEEEGGTLLGPYAEQKCKEGKLDEIVFEGIKDQIAPKSLTTFQTIALQCLHHNSEERATTHEVLHGLKEASEFQEDYEIWEHKLPKDYKQIYHMSDSSDIYSTLRAKDLYNKMCNGILLQQGKWLFTLNRNGERNGLISAKSFFYINRCPHKWRSIPESRFRVVAEMFIILNLKIKMKKKTQLLSPNVVYGVYFVFKFCDPRKVSSKPVYVNLKYRNGRESTSHAYFATSRDNEWMMIELCRFLNDKEDIKFNFLLESLSGYYCRNSTIYVEGIEFRAIDNVKHEEIKEIKKVQKSGSNMDLLQQLPTNFEEIVNISENDDVPEKLLSVDDVNGKKHLMLSAKATVYNYADVKLFKTKPSIQTRFPEVIELLPQQVFRINCTIKSQLLSRDTEYACYLVFKLSEKCRGLHCPVKVRDLLHRNNKDVEIIYFRSPSPWNLHDTNQAPKQRADGWMEVRVWKFKINHELKSDTFRVNLKLISYEGTMSGLIVCGLEFRPM